MPEPQHTWHETLAVYRDLVGQLRFEPESVTVNPRWERIDTRQLQYIIGSGFCDMTGVGQERSLGENSYGG